MPMVAANMVMIGNAETPISIAWLTMALRRTLWPRLRPLAIQ